MINFSSDSTQFIKRGLFFFLFSICFLWSEEIAYKELELELDESDILDFSVTEKENTISDTPEAREDIGEEEINKII